MIKLIVEEPESFGLRDFFAETPARRISSRIAEPELERAARRRGEDANVVAQMVLEDIDLIDVDESVLSLAAIVDGPNLRTLDAIHLATALIIRPQVKQLVTYDRRLFAAAQAEGFEVVAPGAR